VQLEALHQAGVLVPLYRFAFDIQKIVDTAKEGGFPPLSTLPYRLKSASTLLDFVRGITDLGEPLDPRTEPFQPWEQYTQVLDGITFPTSTFFYSSYQLLLIPTLMQLVSKLPTRKLSKALSNATSELLSDLHPPIRQHIVEETIENTEITLLLTALETKYLPRLRGHGTTAQYVGFDIDQIMAYQRSFDPMSVLQQFEWTAERVLTTAHKLLGTADSIDPLRDWYSLVRLCYPDKWKLLRGDALLAFDYRFAAEMFLRFYEDLVKANAATPLPPHPDLLFGPFDRRLNANLSNLDEVLTEFGISPYPSLVLVLEGETEWLLVPRIMDILGISRQRNFIELFKGRGVDTDFGVLATFVATPSLGKQIGENILLIRPPTHFLVAIDPESKFKTEPNREKVRQRWIGQIYNAVPKHYRTDVLKTDLQSLVHVKTWNNMSFEFAHFSDVELAASILDVYKGSFGMPATKLQTILKNIRATGGNIETAWKGWAPPQPTKTALAEVLWPVLEQKIRGAFLNGRYRSIPVVDVLLETESLAATLPRSDVFIRH
jgi:hypothetical protein